MYQFNVGLTLMISVNRYLALVKQSNDYFTNSKIIAWSSINLGLAVLNMLNYKYAVEVSFVNNVLKSSNLDCTE